MPSFKPAYLIHGDDHGRVAERRARLRAIAEAQSGSDGVEVFEGEAAEPEAVARALAAMTLSLGRRFLIVDGVESWKESELDELEAALAALDADTTVAFFAREEGRAQAPGRLARAVARAGGVVAAEQTVKPWKLPEWAVAHARELGIELEPAAARALVSQVGERQQRLLRELEKLALLHGSGARLDAQDVEAGAARSVERKAWSLADALVARDVPAATRLLVELRSQGERVEGLIFGIARRLRDALAVAARLEAGEAEAQVKRSLRMPPRAAAGFVADVRRSDRATLREALDSLAQLELDSRGTGALETDTAAVRTIVSIASAPGG